MLRLVGFPMSALAVILALSACAPVTIAENTDDDAGSGGGGGGGCTDEPAPDCISGHDFYVREVHPILYDQCSVCHATGAGDTPIFLAGDAEASYLMIKENPALYRPPSASALVSKGDHTGPALSTEGLAAVTRWLSIEFSPDPSCGE